MGTRVGAPVAGLRTPEASDGVERMSGRHVCSGERVGQAVRNVKAAVVDVGWRVRMVVGGRQVVRCWAHTAVQAEGRSNEGRRQR